MWGIPYDEYMLHEMSTMGGGSYDFYGFGLDGCVYAGTYLFESQRLLYLASDGRIRVLPKALLESFMAAEEVAEELELSWSGADLLN